jgi:glycosyltransferase involved in cell wall biosynthesis
MTKVGPVPLRVAIATPEYPPHAGGGLGQFYATLAPALVHAGCQVDVVVAGAFSDGFPSYEHDGVHVHGISRNAIDARVAEMPHLSAAPVFRRWVAASRAAHDQVCALAPDVVETTDFGLHFVAFMVEPTPGPVIVQCHGSLGQIAAHEPPQAQASLDLSLSQMAEATLLPVAHDLQSCGSANAAEWHGRLGCHVVVLPPPVPPMAATEDSHDGEGLVVGRIQSWKGPAILCEALRRVPHLRHVRWVGRDTDTGPGRQSLSEHLREKYPDVWGPVVDPVGPLPQAEVRLLQRRARFVMVPSLWDVYNLTAPEAMRAGRVVICSDQAGAIDLIEHGRNGFRVRAGDPAELADVIDRVMSLSAAECAGIGALARETVVAQLNPDANARLRVERMRDLVAAGPGRDPVPDWVAAFFSRAAGGHDRAFLDHVSLRDLSAYVGRRAGKSLLARAGLRPPRAAS